MTDHSPYEYRPELDPSNRRMVAITLPRHEWITIRSALGTLASNEERYANSIRDVLRKKQSTDAAKRIRGIDNKIKTELTNSADKN